MSIILIGFRSGILTDEEIAKVEDAAPGFRVVVTENPVEQEALLDELEIVVGPVRPSLFLRAPHLRWFQGWGAGSDWLMRHPEAVDRDIVVTSAAGIHAAQMTEHIFALLLAYTRRLPLAFQAQTRHEWMHFENDQVFELAGTTMLLVGLGAIGRRVAEVAQSLGMHVLGISRRGGHAGASVEAVTGPEGLDAWLPRADFIVLVAPLTGETLHMIGEKQLRLMKPTAYLVNVGRGRLVDEAALVRALSEGRIAGAGLDVFETEPLSVDSPLWGLPDVVITAHSAGVTPEYDRRATAIFLDNLRRYVAGAPLRNVVDKKLGY